MHAIGHLPHYMNCSQHLTVCCCVALSPENCSSNNTFSVPWALIKDGNTSQQSTVLNKIKPFFF